MTSRSRCGSAASARRTFSRRRFSDASSNGDTASRPRRSRRARTRPPRRRALTRSAAGTCAGCRAPRAACSRGSSRSPRASARVRGLHELALDLDDLVQPLTMCTGCGSCAPCRRSRGSRPGGSTTSRRSRTCSRGWSNSRPRGSGRDSPPGSDRGTTGQDRGSPSRSRRRAAGWPRICAPSPSCRRARCVGEVDLLLGGVERDAPDRAQVQRSESSHGSTVRSISASSRPPRCLDPAREPGGASFAPVGAAAVRGDHLDALSKRKHAGRGPAPS